MHLTDVSLIWSHESVLASLSVCRLILLWPDFCLRYLSSPTHVLLQFHSVDPNDENKAIPGKTHNMPFQCGSHHYKEEKEMVQKILLVIVFLLLYEKCRFGAKK